MTTSRNGKRAAPAHPQNALSINPALLWLASLTPAGRRGMQSLLRRCAGILRPRAKPDTYPWHTLDYTSVMRVSTLFSEYRRSWCQITSGLNVSQPRCVLQ